MKNKLWRAKMEWEDLSKEDRTIYFNKLAIRENRDVQDFFTLLGKGFAGLWD